MKLTSFLPFFWLCGCTFFIACTSRPNISKIKETVHIERADRWMGSITTENYNTVFTEFAKANQPFVDRYCKDIIGIGLPNDDNFKTNLKVFQSDKVVSLSREGIEKLYTDSYFEELANQISNGFKYFRYYFDSLPLPIIYTYYSGFNTSLILDSTYIGIGLDRYLGKDYKIYSQLGIPVYQSKNMTSERMMVDIFRALSLKYFFHPYGTQTLLDEMIAEGKIYYFTQQLLSDIPSHTHFGFTPEQLKICSGNEQYMWNYLIEKNILYTNNLGIIHRMTGEAPFTLEFSREAPGKAACWIGYRIVEQYMKKNSDVSLAELMNNNNYGEILKLSLYAPKK